MARQGAVHGLGLVDFNYPQVRGSVPHRLLCPEVREGAQMSEGECASPVRWDSLSGGKDEPHTMFGVLITLPSSTPSASHTSHDVIHTVPEVDVNNRSTVTFLVPSLPFGPAQFRFRGVDRFAVGCKV